MNRLGEIFDIQKWPASSNPLHNATLILEKCGKLQTGSLAYDDKKNFFKDAQFPMLAFKLIGCELHHVSENDEDEEIEEVDEEDEDDGEDKNVNEDDGEDKNVNEGDGKNNEEDDFDDDEWTTEAAESNNDMTDISDLESVKESILKDLADDQIRQLLHLSMKMKMLNLQKNLKMQVVDDIHEQHNDGDNTVNIHEQHNDDDNTVSSFSASMTNMDDTQVLKKVKI